MTDDIIEGEAVDLDEPGTNLVVRPPSSPTLFHTDDPTEVVARAARTAQPLAEAVRKQRLAVTISGREHVKVEGWTLLGSMLGVFPFCVWTRKIEDGWEARVEARTLAGQIVGSAEAECLRTESTWKNRDDYALRSMAQTRATSKALRQPLGFVMQLAGFDATPAEEMPNGPSSGGAGKITDAQRRRMFAIAGENGVTEETVKRIVAEIAGVSSTKDIPKGSYEAVVAAIQSEGVPFD